MTTENSIAYTKLTSVATAFEGAATDYQNGLRGLFTGTPDQLAVRELKYLISRSEHLCRNDGYAKLARTKWITNANHIKVVWKKKNGKSHKGMQKYWDQFAENPSFDGFGDLKTFQGVSNSSIFTTGASHIRKLIVRENNSNKIPLKLQLIPTSLHAIEYNLGLSTNGETIRYGITFSNSVPVKYHYNKGALQPLGVENYISIPADEIIHTFIRDSPGQWIGIPLLSSVILSLYSLTDLITATINKQKAAASIAIVIEQVGAAMSMLPIATADTVQDSEGKDKIVFRNNPTENQVIYLNNKESAKMFQGTDIGENFTSLIQIELRKIAATLDLAYHELTGDTTGLNYSSLIGLSILSRNRLEYLHNFLFIPLREKPIADSFKDLARIYDKSVADAVPYFQLPRWRGIDELKDTQADLLELQSGLGITADKLAERGLTIEDIQADLENRKILESMGIFLDSSGKNDSMNQPGNLQANANTTST
jgi:lambda family phage portal protein